MSFQTTNLLGGLLAAPPPAAVRSDAVVGDRAATTAGDRSAPPGGQLVLDLDQAGPGPLDLSRWVRRPDAAGRMGWETPALLDESRWWAAGDWPGDGIAPAWSCPRCGGLAWWADLRGGRHCSACEARSLARSFELADRAAQFRASARPAGPSEWADYPLARPPARRLPPRRETAFRLAPGCEPAAAPDKFGR